MATSEAARYLEFHASVLDWDAHYGKFGSSYRHTIANVAYCPQAYYEQPVPLADMEQIASVNAQNHTDALKYMWHFSNDFLACCAFNSL